MSFRTFVRGLLITTLVSALLAAGLHTIDSIQAHWPLSLILIVWYVIMCVGMYFIAQRSARSSNKHQFTTVSMGFTFLKMMTSAGIFLAYTLLADPVGKMFVIPFFLIYLVFTAFELYFMIKLARG